MNHFQILGRPARVAAAASALIAAIAVLGGQLSLFAMASNEATATLIARRAAATSELAARPGAAAAPRRG